MFAKTPTQFSNNRSTNFQTAIWMINHDIKGIYYIEISVYEYTIFLIQ